MTAFPAGWTVVRLEEALEALIDYRGRSPVKTASGVPLVTARAVKNGRIDYSLVDYIADDAYESWMRRGKVRAGDVLLTSEAPLGEVAQVGTERIALAQRLFTLRGLPSRLDNTYLRFALQSDFVRHELHARSSGTTVLGIRQSELRNIRIPLPPLGIQRAIARILGALDDKIALNRKTNETLEAMARALFKSWFVDFDPVRAKMEGRRPTAMNEGTAALFPDGFENSELGEVPRGWTVTPIDHLVLLQRGTTYQGTLVGLPGPALLGLGSIVEGGGFRDGRYKTYGGECPPKLMLKPGDLYVALKGATKDGSMVGSVARVPPTVPSGRLTQDTVKLELRSSRDGIAEWLYRLLLTPAYRSYCAGRITGSAQVGLSREDFLGYRSALPSNQLLSAFGAVERRLAARLDAAHAESRSLAEVRDTLLPKLMSGELRVPVAERIVEAAS